MALPFLFTRTSPKLPIMQSHEREACCDFLQRLVQTPSFSGQEAAAARLIASEMRAQGFPSVRIDRIGNVIGRYGRSGGPLLLLNGHMDTVGVGDADAWDVDPFAGEVREGRLYGLGSVDMKGALAAMVHGVGLLARRGVDLPGEVVVAAVVQEEPTEGMAMRVLVEEEGVRPDWVVLGEPTNLQVARGHRGRMEIRISVFGRASHASTPEEGENALTNAARLIFSLDLLGGGLMSDAVLGKGSLAVTQLVTVASGRNAIPARCDLVVDRRLTLGETPTRALAEIEAVMQREAIRGKVEMARYHSVSYTGYETEGAESYPAWLMPEDHPLVAATCESLERRLGRRPALRTWPFSTDGAYTMGEAGIPTVGFGPGEARLAHTANESIRLDDVQRAAQAYAGLVYDLLWKLVEK